MLCTSIWVHAMIGLLKTILSICQSGWREIRNAFLVIHWGGLEQENWHSFAYINSQGKILGTLYSTKMSGLNFRQLPVMNGTASPKIFKKRTMSQGIPKFSQTFYQQFSFHSIFLPKFLEFSVQWFACWKFNSFQNFWKLFREISVPFSSFSKHSKVLVEWKALYISDAGNARTYSLTKTQTSKIVI